MWLLHRRSDSNEPGKERTARVAADWPKSAWISHGGWQKYLLTQTIEICRSILKLYYCDDDSESFCNNKTYMFQTT